jgi:hypothetical protein
LRAASTERWNNIQPSLVSDLVMDVWENTVATFSRGLLRLKGIFVSHG